MTLAFVSFDTMYFVSSVPDTTSKKNHSLSCFAFEKRRVQARCEGKKRQWQDKSRRERVILQDASWDNGGCRRGRSSFAAIVLSDDRCLRGRSAGCSKALFTFILSRESVRSRVVVLSLRLAAGEVTAMEGSVSAPGVVIVVHGDVRVGAPGWPSGETGRVL
jgi:hypothetical protein